MVKTIKRPTIETMKHINRITLIFISCLLCACAGTPPKSITQPQSLQPCPSSPNCVSSYAEKNDAHYIAPLDSKLSIEEKLTRMHRLLSAKSNIAITQKEKGYLRAEATSSFWRFVDDLEFLFTPEQIFMRSASRLGYSDFGVNRRRLEAIRSEFKADLLEP